MAFSLVALAVPALIVLLIIFAVIWFSHR